MYTSELFLVLLSKHSRALRQCTGKRNAGANAIANQMEQKLE